LCDKSLRVIFDDSTCDIIDGKSNSRILFVFMRIMFISLTRWIYKCKNEDSWLWYKSFGHVSLEHLSRITSKKMVKGIHILKFKKDCICGACQLEKQTKSYFKSMKDIMTSRPLDLIYVDLFGLTKTKNLNGNRFVFFPCWWFLKIYMSFLL